MNQKESQDAQEVNASDKADSDRQDLGETRMKLG